MLERTSWLDDPSFPTENGDGEGDEEEQEERSRAMHLSEARADLYQKVFDWVHREEQDMSRLHKDKSYYVGGETESLVDVVGWTTSKAGYLEQVEVTYRLPDGQLRTLREPVVGYPGEVEEKLVEMLSRKIITHPE